MTTAKSNSRPSNETLEWNPRYVAYAKANGRSPAAMLENDRQEYPGGCMAGFICWISGQWSAWRRLRGLPRDHILTDGDHSDFDAWLVGLKNVVA